MRSYLFLCSVCLFSVAGALAAEDAPVTPVRALLYTAEEVAAVREVVKTDATARSVAAGFVRGADAWMRRGAAEIELLFPPDDAIYAYGFSGDPKVNKPWSWWGRDGEASLDRPGVVRSSHTGDLYGNQKPGEEFYDDGRGWTRPSDGKVFYFKGVWHSYVIRALHDAVDDLSMAYLLTGNAAYAERALWLLDRFATMRSRRDKKDGAIDWAGAYPEGYGFFTYMGNLANDRMVASAFALDIIGRAPAASAPAAGTPGLTVFENIRRNYFSVFEKWYVDDRSSFQNHGVSAYANQTAQALLFGRADEVRAGVEAAYGFLDNAVDRDGEYYEVSASYGEIGRIYGGSLLSLFTHYDPAGYDSPGDFPAPAAWPHGLRFGTDPVWFQTAVSSLYRITIQGRRPHYGNYPNIRYTATHEPGNRAPNIHELRATYLRLFHAQTERPEWRELCRRLYRELPEAVRTDAGFMRKGVLQYGPSQWGQLPPPADPAAPLPWPFQEDRSTVTGQKRMALLRSGEGKAQRGVFLRGGVTNSHAQDEQMGISLYSHGMPLNGEYGAGLWGTPDHFGWATRAAAHKMLVVDEDQPPGPLFPPRPPASVEGYVPLGSAQSVELSNPSHWSDTPLADYRRQTWLVDLPGGGDGYFVDFFWAVGGRTHDYFWNAPYPESAGQAGLRVEGVEPVAVPGVWTLAALDRPEWREAAFNLPGRSWGERLDIGTGTIRNLPGEKLARNRWNPEPGNGYGFIWDVKAAETRADWSAVWPLHDKRHSLRFTMLNPDGQTVVTAKAPAYAADRHHEIAVARRKAPKDGVLASRFASVTQVGTEDAWPLGSIALLPGPRNGALALAVERGDGGRDLVLATRAAAPELEAPGVVLHGRRAFVRKDASGALVEAVLSDGTLLQAEGVTLRMPAAAWTGAVTAATPGEVHTDLALPSGAALAGQGVMFSAPPRVGRVPYAANEFFLIEELRPADGGRGSVFSFASQRIAAGRVKIEGRGSDGLLEAAWPNEIPSAYVIRQPGVANRTRVFDGHLLEGEADPSRRAIIEDYPDKRRLRVDRPGEIAPGGFYRIMATQRGDVARIPSLALLRRDSGGWTLLANMDVELRPPAGWSVSAPDGSILKADTDGLVLIPVAWQSAGPVRLVAETR